MSTQRSRPTTEILEVPLSAPPALPPWVVDLLERAGLEPIGTRHEGLKVGVARGRGLTVVHALVPNVRSMDILTFQQVVAEAYLGIFEQLRLERAPWPVRFWAFIPGIHAVMSPGLDRYMAFNAGRFAAYSSWCGGREAFSRSIPTASAVGTWGEDLALFCLAAETPGTPAENPRQIPAYRYSRKYGPMPPCFARGTLVERAGGRLFLAGGTASICGEDSLHVGNLDLQVDETLRNLASLVRSAHGLKDGEEGGLGWLDRFRELRIYHPRSEDRAAIVDRVQERFVALERIELIRAELCRQELLVEIEGIADA